MVLKIQGNNNKAKQIIALFKENNGDAKITALQAGFTCHREMAAYLREQGYIWSRKENSYIYAAPEMKREEFQRINNINKTTKQDENKKNKELNQSALDKYIPLLKFLAQHQEELTALLKANPTNKEHYPLKNNSGIKPITIVGPLEKMLMKLAAEKNITPQVVVETALGEFFQKHGYRKQHYRDKCSNQENLSQQL